MVDRQSEPMPARSAFDRMGIETVIRFKASVDELSRLCAGRGEDEQLLAQLEQRLHALSPSVAARLLLECRFREEWREDRAAGALRSLPCARAEPQAVDRMREYVSMLAPQRLYESAGEPWQLELLKQQQALAAVLQLCPSNSPELVMRTLTDFMDHSHKRLAEHLDVVQWKVSEEQHRRQSLSRAASLPDSPVKNAGDHAAALTADAFLDRLQRQRAAVCKLQTYVRGRQQRCRYHHLLQARFAAAVRLQVAGRRGAACRLTNRLREAALSLRQQAIAERYNASRLQRARRWVLRNRQWRATWQTRVREEEQAELLDWRRYMRQFATGGLHKSPSEEDFSTFATYVPGTRIRERRQAEQLGVRTIQAHARGMRDRQTRQGALRAARKLQAAWRAWHGRTRCLWWRRSIRRLHEARSAQLRWSALVASTRRLLPLQTRAVLVELHVGKELDAVRKETAREREDFEAAFAKWVKGMRKQTLARKLHSDWIPQMEPSTGGTYYFNLKTAETTTEHPNMRVARATEKREFAKGEAKLAQRLNRLRLYESGLEGKFADEMQGFEEAVGRQMRELTTGWRRACCFPVYYRAHRVGFRAASSATSELVACAANSDILAPHEAGHSSQPRAQPTPRGSRSTFPSSRHGSARRHTSRDAVQPRGETPENGGNALRLRLPSAPTSPRAPPSAFG